MSLILARLAALFAGHGLKIGIAAAVAVVFATWRHDIKESGRQEVRVEIGKANNAAVETADRIRARAQSGGVRKHRPDPYTTD